ncbi:hypothetical protein [Streptomyces sp. NPDC019937]|uniref:hypothetical protein n=1 Tax=Streptomyces sp. NPDC019937 TaxID=3154787 RepID=UPI0033FBC83D
MAGRQLPAAIEEFASYLRALARRIDPDQGWYAVFAQRDPDGLRACLAGQEIPPWDVVQALLQDLSAQRGAQTANVAAARAATLYRASITVHDAAPGTREALSARLAAMRRERLAAADRESDLLEAQRAGADTSPDGDPIEAALAWAQDDHYRATARCEELTARLAALPTDGPPSPISPGAPGRGPVDAPPGFPGGASLGAPGGGPAGVPGGGPVGASLGAPGSGLPGAPAGGPPGFPGGGPLGAAPGGGPPGAPTVGGPGAPADGPLGAPAGGPPGVPGGGPAGAPGSGPPGFLGSGLPGAPGGPAAGAGRSGWAAGVLQDPSTVGLAGRLQPDGGAPAPAGEGGPPPPPRPRGARFPGVRGGARKREREAEQRARANEQQELAEARRAAGGAVARLGRLRAEGRSGEAHAVLCETAVWPAVRLPVLAAELERAGLGVDVSTLLWEMACLPPERLAAAAEALIAAGREADGERLLRQSVSRPLSEVAHTALALLGNAAHREVALLLTAFIRARTPAEVAEAAAEDPGALVPPLLDAAGAVSPGSQHDLAHALRVAGIQGAG